MFAATETTESITHVGVCVCVTLSGPQDDLKNKFARGCLTVYKVTVKRRFRQMGRMRSGLEELFIEVFSVSVCVCVVKAARTNHVFDKCAGARCHALNTNEFGFWPEVRISPCIAKRNSGRTAWR